MSPAANRSIDIQQRLLSGIDALALRLGRNPANVAPHLATGLRGEEEAFFHLRKLGYTIVARRWQTPKLQGDIDLIAWDGETLCFIEVKTRTGRNMVPAEFAVDQSKQKTLRSMASVFRKRFPEPMRSRIPTRFDVVAVYLPAADFSNQQTDIELFPGAF